MSYEELSQVFFIDVLVLVQVNHLEGIMHWEASLFLSDYSQLLCFDLVLQVGGPCLKEEFSCLRVEDLLFRNHVLRVHRQRRLLSQQACMEWVLWEECLAELRVAELLVMVLVESLHEQAQLIVCHIEA